MSQITKAVNRAVFPLGRKQVFTSADASEGDILLIQNSLGHAAAHLQIDAVGSDIQVRFNVIQHVFPTRVFGGPYSGIGNINTALGVEIIDSGLATITVASGTSLNLDNEGPIRDIQLVTVSGDFNVIVS